MVIQILVILMVKQSDIKDICLSINDSIKYTFRMVTKIARPAPIIHIHPKSKITFHKRFDFAENLQIITACLEKLCH